MRHERAVHYWPSHRDPDSARGSRRGQAAELQHRREFDGIDPTFMKPADFAPPTLLIPVERRLRLRLDREPVVKVDATRHERHFAAVLRLAFREIWAARAGAQRQAAGSDPCSF